MLMQLLFTSCCQSRSLMGLSTLSFRSPLKLPPELPAPLGAKYCSFVSHVYDTPVVPGLCSAWGWKVLSLCKALHHFANMQLKGSARGIASNCGTPGRGKGRGRVHQALEGACTCYALLIYMPRNGEFY